MKTSSGVEGIARIEIQKRIDLIQIIIYMGFPKILIESRPRGIEELQMNLQKEFNSVNRKLNIAITRIEKPYGNPNILAEFIAGQLKNRVSFRKAMKPQEINRPQHINVPLLNEYNQIFKGALIHIMSKASQTVSKPCYNVTL
ncbi:putative ribosomal protein S3 domain superfamily [Helianthus debilis subsp. tardiflorus]